MIQDSVFASVVFVRVYRQPSLTSNSYLEYSRIPGPESLGSESLWSLLIDLFEDLVEWDSGYRTPSTVPLNSRIQREIGWYLRGNWSLGDCSGKKVGHLVHSWITHGSRLAPL